MAFNWKLAQMDWVKNTFWSIFKRHGVLRGRPFWMTSTGLSIHGITELLIIGEKHISFKLSDDQILFTRDWYLQGKWLAETTMMPFEFYVI